MCEIIKNNACGKGTKWSFIAVMVYNLYSPVVGQTFTDNYSTSIFDKLHGEGFGYELTFYEGIVVVIAGLCVFAFIEKLGRQWIIVWGYMGMVAMMWCMSLGFYMNWLYVSVTSNLLFTFILYFSVTGSCFVWPNEVSQPFVVGLGFTVNWIMKNIASEI